jgi:hypothetical protein
MPLSGDSMTIFNSSWRLHHACAAAALAISKIDSCALPAFERFKPKIPALVPPAHSVETF